MLPAFNASDRVDGTWLDPKTGVRHTATALCVGSFDPRTVHWEMRTTCGKRSDMTPDTDDQVPTCLQCIGKRHATSFIRSFAIDALT